MATNTPPATRLRISVSASQAAAIDKFQATEKLETRAEAVRLLLEIGLDTVGGKGWRFWDAAPE